MPHFKEFLFVNLQYYRFVILKIHEKISDTMDQQCGNVVATVYALLIILTYLIFSFLRSTDGKCFLETNGDLN